jgi:hypothetical protein
MRSSSGYCLIILICQYCVLVSCHFHSQSPLQEHEQKTHFEAGTIDIPIDHFNIEDNRTYANRFWTNDTFYQPGGPVFFYDAGERGVSDGNLISVSLPAHPLMNLTKAFHGLAVVWEHRFFGRSSPLPLETDSTDAEKQAAYSFLNTEQALEDAVFFAKHFELDGLERFHTNLKPQNTPWIWIGGSYPGQRAAMIRRRNPDIFFASYSSSASIEIRTNLPEYYLHISHDLPERCGEIVRKAVRYADGVLRDGTRLEKFKLRWAIARRWPASKATLKLKLIYVLAAPDYIVASQFMGLVAADWQWRGMSVEGRMGVTCASIRGANFDSVTSSRTAIETILDAIEANDRHFAGNSGGSGLSLLDNQAWQYQVCTEYFHFRTAAPQDQYNIISTLFTEDNIWTDTCARNYPWLDRPSKGELHVPSLYTGWDKNFSNVMFITGMKDPWQEVSIVPSRSLVPDAPRDRVMTDEVPLCNELMAGNEVFGLVLPEGRHCGDLIAGSEDARKATELFMKALEVWLPCFGR